MLSKANVMMKRLSRNAQNCVKHAMVRKKGLISEKSDVSDGYLTHALVATGPSIDL